MPMDYEGYPIHDKDVAAPLGSFKRELRQSVPLKYHSEVEDLTKAENSPNKDSKKISKNASVSFRNQRRTNLVDIEETYSNLILRSREMSHHAFVDVTSETDKICDDIDVGWLVASNFTVVKDIFQLEIAFGNGFLKTVEWVSRVCLLRHQNRSNTSLRTVNIVVLGKSDEGGYYKTYGSDAEGEKGYLKETYSKGDHGYKTFDTFHKQDGDKYGFEKQFAYGKGRRRKDSDKHAEESSNISKHDDHESAGTIVDSHYVDNEGDHTGEHYSGDYGSHYTAAEPDSESYTDTGDGHSENYSTGSGSEGSYENHSSYSSSSDSGDNNANHY
ncbi:hypothetical protein M0802_010381 [Mischocyttarus mexicanus]|nr:hypothetical protein M0802_010381 [Mischocyttarus mexicanus]